MNRKIPLKLFLMITLLFIAFSLTSCTMYSSKGLMQTKTSHSWNVKFKALNGDIAHEFNNDGGEISEIICKSQVGQGTMTLEVQMNDKIEKIELGQQTVDVSQWEKGTFILRIIGEDAQDGRVEFEWR